MSRYLLRRLLVAALLVWVVLTLAFVVIQLAPGDPVSRYLDPRVPRVHAERLLALYGWDQPIGRQYLGWLRSLVQGELGTSFLFKRPVLEVVADHLLPTLLLGGTAFVLQMMLGSLLGIVAALRSGSWCDHAVRVVSAAVYALPTFWLGLMLVLVFSGMLGWLPPGGLSSPYGAHWSLARRVLDVLHHLVLPACVLGIPLSAPVARLLRNGLLEELSKDYVAAARARGLPPRRVILHAVRNAAAPVIQLAGLSVPLLVGGSVVVEQVFGWPGLGAVTVSAIQARDYPLVMGITLLAATSVVVGNLAADLGHGWLDPRVRQP